MLRVWLCFVLLCATLLGVVVCDNEATFFLPLLVNNPDPAFHTGKMYICFRYFGAYQQSAAYRVAVEDINNSSVILPDRILEIDLFFSLNPPVRNPFTTYLVSLTYTR